jgi:Spy/CpxP family protein refolding chaperone
MVTIGTTARKALGVLALAAMIPVSGWAFGGPGMGGRSQGPPQEAFDACAGKKAGDTVRFTTPCGDNVSAVCRDYDGKLAAAPGEGRGWHGKGKGMGHGRHFGRMARDLDLTAEQEKQIRGILDAEREKNAPLHQQMRENREQLRKIAEKTPFDEAAVRKLAAEKEKTHIELVVSRARAMHKVSGLLTPGQKEKAGEAGPFGRGFGPGCADCPMGK